MVIYIDVLFLINFISDLFILILCDSSLSKKCIIKKICASFIGSIYACLFVFDLPDIFYSAIFKIIVSMTMCFISFYPATPAFLLKKCTLFIFISIIFSGIFYTINSFFIFRFSDAMWILCISSSFLICKYAFYKIKSELYSRNCKIKIYYKDKFAIFNGMIDTGNSMVDPISKKPVLIIDERVLKKLFSPSATQNNLCEFVNSKDFCVIPYKTISNQGVTFGFVPDKLICNGKEVKNTIIAIAPSPISSDALINIKTI